jgi:hypothetical protein
LGQIKEEHSIVKAGVVPEDLGFGILKDLIDLSEEDRNRGKNKEKTQPSQFAKKKTTRM